MKRLLPLLVLGLCCVTGFAQQLGRQDAAILHVNGEPVIAAEITLHLQNLVAQAANAGQEPNREQLVQLAMDQAVSGKLLVQEARRKGIEWDADRVAQMLSENAAAAGGEEKLKLGLQGAGLRIDHLERALRETDMTRQLVRLHVAPGITVSNEEIDAFYAENPESFRSRERIRARHILIRFDTSMNQKEIEAARQKAEAARQRVLQGEEFANVASEVSEGPNASRGGDLGFFAEGQMVSDFYNAANSLQLGQVSEVVKTRFGFHVIKLEERRSAGLKALDEVRDSVRQHLMEQKIAPHVNALVEELKKDASIEQITSPGAESEE
jgi:peptidyl-prolyl cis-trans isomerase C